MVFESVRGYVQLASGLSELTRARATEAAQGLLSLQGSGLATGSKLAVQVSALAEELLAAATTNRHNLTALVRSEVDAAVTRLGLVSAEKLAESQAEASRLRSEVAELRSASPRTTGAKKTTAKKTAAKKTTAKKTTAKKTTAKKTAAKKTAAKKTAAKKTAANKTAANKTAANKTAVAEIAPKDSAATSAEARPVTMAATSRGSAVSTAPRTSAGT
jgi:hypothetical protein